MEERSEQKQTDYRSHLLYPLYLNYAKRSLYGGGKGSFVMEELRLEDPQFYKFVMQEATDLLNGIGKDPNTLSNEVKLQEMRKLVQSNLTNMESLFDNKESNKGEV